MIEENSDGLVPDLARPEFIASESGRRLGSYWERGFLPGEHRQDVFHRDPGEVGAIFDRRRPDVGKHDDVRGGEQVGVDPGLLFEDIEAGAVDSSITQRRGEGGLVDHGSAAHVHQDRFGFHHPDGPLVHQVSESTRSGSWSAPRHRRSGDLLRE